MEAARLTLALALPWLAGYAWLRAARGRDASNPWLDWGCAQFAGILLLTLTMRAADAAGIPLRFAYVAPLVAALGIAGAAVAWRRGRDGSMPTPNPAVAGDPLAFRGLAIVALAFLAWRLGTLAVDVVLRPLFPWDAWTQWATKARVWSSFESLVPFVDPDRWLERVPGYTDAAPHYPATLPLLQTWMLLAKGSFDDAAMNLPWLAAAVALAMGLYGQLRQLGVGAAWALFATYVALSLPMLDTHVALAGYADLHVAAVFALALGALAEWERSRATYALARCAALALLLPLLKVPGIAWSAVLIVGFFVAWQGRAWRRLVPLLLATAAVTVGAAALLWQSRMAHISAGSTEGVLGSLFDNLFLFDNWHLLWYVVPIVAWAGRREIAHSLRGTGAALAAGGLFLVFVLAGTKVAAWVTDYTTVNRAILHIAPAIAMFAALVLWRWAVAREARVADAASAPPAVAQQAVEVGDGAGEAVAQADGRRPAEQ